MILKSDLYLWITPHLLPINTFWRGYGPIFVRILVLLCSTLFIANTCTSHVQALSVSQKSRSISESLTRAGPTKTYQFCKYFRDHNSWSWLYFLFFFPPIMGNPPRSGWPPTGSAGRLPPDLGAVSSRLGQYPSSQNPTDALR